MSLRDEMNSIRELSEVDRLKVMLARIQLSDVARAYAFAQTADRQSYFLDRLLEAARAFDRACRDAGLDRAWVPSDNAVGCCCGE